MNATPRRHILVLAVSMIVLAATSPARADNVCAQLATGMALPIKECVTPEQAYRCFFLPQCCAPGACFVDPLCGAWSVVDTVKNFQAGEMYCEFSPEEFVRRWLAGEFLNTTNLLTSGLPQAFLVAWDSHAQAVATRAQPIPDNVRDILLAMVGPFYDQGRTGYSSGDVFEARIISSADSEAAQYFQGPTVLGVTVGPFIGIRDDLFVALTQEQSSAEDLHWGRASPMFSNALETLAHELVHKGQFRRYGADAFRTDYLLQYVFNGGYDNSPYEDEAYSYSADLAETWGGFYCEDTRPHHEGHIASRNLPMSYGPCHHYGPFVATMAVSIWQ